MAQNDENCVDDPEPLANSQRPRKPSSAYFYFMKKHRVRLQQQHPTWPMKRITSSVATLWSKTSPENRAPFIEMAENDSIRYKEQVTYCLKCMLLINLCKNENDVELMTNSSDVEK